jgi:hypothetical protein
VGWLLARLTAAVVAAAAARGCCCVSASLRTEALGLEERWDSASLRTETLKNRKEERF